MVTPTRFENTLYSDLSELEHLESLVNAKDKELHENEKAARDARRRRIKEISLKAGSFIAIAGLSLLGYTHWRAGMKTISGRLIRCTPSMRRWPGIRIHWINASMSCKTEGPGLRGRPRQ